MSSTVVGTHWRVAVLGGTGFVGGRVTAQLQAAGVEAVVLSRRTGLDLASPDVDTLARALAGCSALVICAGINRELGPQTYDAIHIRGTAAAVEAARRAGVGHVGLVSFLRARPDGPSAYHRSKWAAEAIVREGGVPFTILKCGVIYGHGDHLLDHLSHALHTFPVFGLVGMRELPVAPVAVDDVARILVAAALGEPRLRDRTLAVLGPETLSLGAAVRRVGTVVGRRPVYVRLPIAAHLVLARVCEQVMRVPLVAVAQVHILAEGVVEAAPPAHPLPPDLAPTTPFSEASIRAGLPGAGPFGCRDLRWWPAT
jgi:NADH dehydrogenase